MAEKNEDSLAHPPAKYIAKTELEPVIRRAAELYMEEAAREIVDEDELVAIAGELGIPRHYVRQALYERVRLGEPSLVDRVWGPRHVVLHRSVNDAEKVVLGRVEDYLVAEQYLRLERRQGERRTFVPADDTITRALRTFTRPASRYPLARVRRVEVAVRPLEEHSAHVSVAVDLGDRRRSSVRGALLGGGALSAIVGTGVGLPMGFLIAQSAGPEVGVAAGILGGATTLAAGLGVSVSVGARRFRRKALSMRHDVEQMLDRLQHGLRLGPGPAPWRHRRGDR